MEKTSETSRADDDPPRRTDWGRIGLLWLCGMGAGLQFAKASIGFDALAAYYQASPTLAGWLLSSVGAVGVVFGATAGLIVGRAGRRRSLVAALFGACLLSLIQATLPSVGALMTTRILEGATHLAIIVAAPVCLPDLTAPRHRAIVMALWGTFFNVAFLMAGAVGPALLAGFGLKGLFAAHAAYMGIFGVAAFVFAPAERTNAIGADPTRLSADSIFGQHVEVYSDPRTAVPALCFLCYTGMFLALQTFTPALATVDDRPWLVVGMPFVSIVTTLAAGAIAQYWLSPFRLAAFAFLAVIAASLALHVAFVADSGVLPVGLLRMALVSLLPGAIYPMIPLLCASPAVQARAYGAIAQLGNVGSVLGPPLFAASFAALGAIGLAVAPIALSACGFALASFAARKFAVVEIAPA
jgi:AAHS family 3-hydroxyphenylpropionic acid transporter